MNIAKLLLTAARAYPDHPAIRLGRSPVATYGALLDRALRIGGNLRRRFGLEAGARVGIAMRNCPQYIEVMWAAWSAGLCIVPVNARLHPKEIAYIATNSAVGVIFADDTIAEGLARELGAGHVPIIDVASREFALLAQGEPVGIAAARPDMPAWLFYTSGTTGHPKGATLSHGSLLAMGLRYYADIDTLSPADSMIHMAPLSHAGGLFSIPHLAKGSTQILPEAGGFDVDELLSLVEATAETTFFAAPTMLQKLTHEAAARGVRAANIKTIVYGGAPMYVQNLREALAVFGPRLWQGYGQGETPNTITSLAKHAHVDDGSAHYEARLASVGIPRTGVEVRVVDPQGRDCAIGEVGEVICRSDVTMTGYWNNPKATADALRDGWLHTGDLGTFSEQGYLTLKDRSKDVIISGGMNIYPREVEEAILLHEGVLEVSVIGRPSDAWGEEVVAVLVAKPGRQVREAELDAVCNDNIARFKRPKRYVFVQELPKSGYGKILKRELRNLIGGEGPGAP